MIPLAMVFLSIDAWYAQRFPVVLEVRQSIVSTKPCVVMETYRWLQPGKIVIWANMSPIEMTMQLWMSWTMLTMNDVFFTLPKTFSWVPKTLTPKVQMHWPLTHRKRRFIRCGWRTNAALHSIYSTINMDCQCFSVPLWKHISCDPWVFIYDNYIYTWLRVLKERQFWSLF